MNKCVSFAVSLVLAGCCSVCPLAKKGPVASAVSPDGRKEIRVYLEPLAYEVVGDGETLVAKSEIGMKVDGKCLNAAGLKPAVTASRRSGRLETPVYKKSAIDLAANETFLDFGEWGVRLVARNDGVAYRFETKFGGEITVGCEKADFTMADAGATCYVNRTRSFGCEETLNRTLAAKSVTTAAEGPERMIYLPFVFERGGKTVAVTESDVWDYPILNYRRAADGGAVRFTSYFSNFPATTYRAGGWDRGKRIEKGGRWVCVDKPEDFLVRTAGSRTFPWRVFLVADKASDLCAADAVYALARPADPKADFSWVKPGKVAWDWWNAWDNQGMKEGCNTATYRRFFDFAAKTGVEYIIFDEGWSADLDIWNLNPEVDLRGLVDYGNSKGVGTILWIAWAQAYGCEAKVAEHFAAMGVKGFKVDFMDRGDADVERFLWKFADECAKRKLVVDYHGAHRPTGMQRAYPNVLNFEGVHGLECMKFYGGEDFMANDLKVFYCRMTAGPMDYTPGAMDNYPVGDYPRHDRRRYNDPGSEGTRVHQMALMALYEAPFQMLSEAPTKFEKNPECFGFMAATPVVWADTVGLGGTPDTYAAAARKAKDGSWYAAAISNRDARTVELDTAFLGAGEWKAEVFRDAEDADQKPSSYVHETKTVRGGEKLTVKLAKGGGYVVKFVK